MIKLSHLSESALLENTYTLAKQERKITLEVLVHLREIEKRRAYALVKCTSLFQYAVKELKYSAGAANRRINAARALKDLPDLADKIEEGEISVTQVSRVQSFIKKEEKESGVKWSASEKSNLFKKAEESTEFELEQELVKISPKAAVRESVKPVTPNLIEVKLYLSEEELQELNSMRALLAHELKNPGSNSELVNKLLQISKERVRERKFGKGFVMRDKTRQEEKSEGLGRRESKMDERELGKKTKQANSNSEKRPKSETQSQHTAEPQRSGASSFKGHSRTQSGAKPKRSEKPQVFTRVIPAETKRFLFQRSNLQCEHIDPKTKTRCPSKFKLEIDHIKPFSLGGTHAVENLRVLCKGHNLNRTREL